MNEIIIALIGSSALYGFIQFLVSRHDNKKNRIGEMEKNLQRIEQSTVRAEMLLMIDNHPEQEAEIFKLAEYYFDTLHGDMYMSSKFATWLEEHKITKPLWFGGEH